MLVLDVLGRDVCWESHSYISKICLGILLGQSSPMSLDIQTPIEEGCELPNIS